MSRESQPGGSIGVVGAGVMGAGIAQIAAQAGFSVILFDAVERAAEKARETIGKQFARLCEKGRMTSAAAEEALLRIHAAPNFDSLASAEIVIEAIVEKIEVKRELFSRLDALVTRSCVLATNTSSLSVTAIAAATANPERVAGLHFFNPVPLMKVAEVISGARTAPETAGRLAAFVERIGHTPVRAQDTPGFIVNHAGRGYVTEALKIVQENVASPGAVDAVLREAAGFRLGPFELLDLTGLDVSHPVMESIYHQYYEEPRYRPSVISSQRLAAGLLGRKSGRGFYGYGPDGKLQQDARGESANAGRPWKHPVWVSPASPASRELIAAFLKNLGIEIETANSPSANAACIVTPEGEDVSTCVARERLDGARTVGLDTLTGCTGRMTLMISPATKRESAAEVVALLSRGGTPVSLIEDSAGFIVPRVLAMIVNIGCEIVQQGICSPADLDRAVELGLGYPHGPLAWGEKLGSTRVLKILQNMQSVTGDPRYRPSPWLARRAQLGVSLRASHAGA
ncbi:MAG: 3-hydroxyacyl-CoA dehydrogenase [Candidatus Acidiferrales bacterium]